MTETDVTDTRAVQLKRAGFHRVGDSWARGPLVIPDRTLAAMDDITWAQQLRRWRQQRR